MSNIEEDIQMLKTFKVKGNYMPNHIDRMIEPKEVEAIYHVLQELEQDKKRLKELEEALLKVKEKNIKLFINSKNSIPVQKVKDKIKYYKKLQNNYIKKYDEVNDTLQGMINVLKEIVEDK